MNRHLKYRLTSFTLASLLAAACAIESRRNEPVTTTTDKGSSTAPPAKEAEKRGRALVRVIHAVPGGAAGDIFADNTKAFPGVAYKTVTPYRELSDDRHDFRLRPAGHDAAPPLAEQSENFSGGKHYTVIALPTDATAKEVTLKIVADNLVPPPAGKAKVRVIQASPDAGEIDIYAKGQERALFSRLDFKSEAGYAEIDPMSVTLEVRPEGKKDSLLTVPGVRFEVGKIYTLIVTGRTKGTPKLEAIKVEDQLTGPTGEPVTASPTPTIPMK